MEHTESDTAWAGIAEMSELCGLSTDTLRWYEKEGLIPPVDRGPDGRRRYSAAQRSVILLLTTLRDTGMPTSDMRQFVELMAEGAASHGRRIAVLERTRERLAERRAALDAAEIALDAKIHHYAGLIDAGLDCDGAPVPSSHRAAQASRDLDPRKDAV